MGLFDKFKKKKQEDAEELPEAAEQPVPDWQDSQRDNHPLYMPGSPPPGGNLPAPACREAEDSGKDISQTNVLSLPGKLAVSRSHPAFKHRTEQEILEFRSGLELFIAIGTEPVGFQIHRIEPYPAAYSLLVDRRGHTIGKRDGIDSFLRIVHTHFPAV